MAIEVARKKLSLKKVNTGTIELLMMVKICIIHVGKQTTRNLKLLRYPKGSKQELNGSGGVSIGVVVSPCTGIFIASVNVSIPHHFRIQSHIYLAVLDGVVSQLLVELPRTVKGQNGVEFDFQSI